MLLDIGSERIYFPMIDADDAASAVVAALGAASGTYDVVDEPTTRREQTLALAASVGRRRLLHAPAWFVPKKADYLARVATGVERSFP